MYTEHVEIITFLKKELFTLRNIILYELFNKNLVITELLKMVNNVQGFFIHKT